MNSRSISAALATFGLGLLLTWPGLTFSQDQPPPPPPGADDNGVEVLTRGPVHEAYAEPVDTRPPPSPLIEKQPPDPIDEMPAEMKPEGENVVWIPGYWGWDDGKGDFIWVSGFWRVPPPDRQWLPGHWDQVEGGWQWTPGFWSVANQTDVQYLPPPPPSIDAGPSTPAPEAEAVYAPGTWVYQDTRYVWRPGFWVTPQPGWVWTPAHYVWTPVGYVFVDGYWDYPLANRGLLFTPVWVNYRALRRGWYYRPAYAVYSDFLLGALFVRPAWNSYYFGDYFDPAFRRRGFTAWVDFRVGRSAYDPLFAYYRWEHRNNPDWGRDLRRFYVARFNGDVPRPPVTLAQQQTVIQNITNQNITNRTTILQSVTVAAPVTRFQSSTVRLTRLSQPQVQRYRQAALAFRQTSVQRGRTEAQLLAQGPAPTRPTERPRVARLEIPRAAATTTVRPARTPPPAPTKPAHVERSIPQQEAPRAEVHRPIPPSERSQPRPGERPATRPPERDVTPPERPATRPPERPASRPPETKPPERPASRPPETKPPERPAPRPPETKPPERPAPKPPSPPPPPPPSKSPPPKKDKDKG